MQPDSGPVLFKLTLAWTITLVSWNDISYILASVLSGLLIVDHVWKKYIKPWRNSKKWENSHGSSAVQDHTKQR